MFIEVISGEDAKKFVNMDDIKEFSIDKDNRKNTYKIEILTSYGKHYYISYDYTEEELLKLNEVMGIFNDK